MENKEQEVINENSLAAKIVTGIKSLFVSDPIKHLKDEPDGDEPIKVSKTLPPAKDTEKAQNEAEKIQNEKDEAAKKKFDAKVEKFAKRINECESEAEFKGLKTTCEDEYENEMPDALKKAIAKKEAGFKKAKEENEVKAKEKVEETSKEPEKVEEKKETKKEENQSIINLIKPQMKTPEQLTASEKTVEAPKPQISVNLGDGTTFSELNSKPEGRRIIEKVANATSKDINDHSILLNSLINDSKFAAILEKCKIIDKTGNRAHATSNLFELASRLNSRNLETVNFKTGRIQQFTELGSSDTLLATPDTQAVEFLSIFLLKLFASNKWKSEIPMFGASETGQNLGIIWTNIAADPEVYEGTQPSTPASYQVDDTPVSMALTPFYLQPMLWNPLKTAYLRYDKMAAQWEQALLKLNERIDDRLIYTLCSLIPSASRIFTTGSSFSIANSIDLDEFVLNPDFVGSLLKPTLSEILRIEQLFKKQNFADGTKFVTTLDPTMDRYITGDVDTKSLLTRFVNSMGDELVSFKNGMFRVRSKLGLYDPNTMNVIDASGIIPTSSVGACPAFIPSQVGIGIGNFNVYMVQDPTNYGYKMSADVRMGIAALRKNGYGTALLTYGSGSSV